MPDTDDASSFEELVPQLIKSARKVYRAIYLHIPATKGDDIKPSVTIDKCVVCKRMSVGHGVMHRPDCPIRQFAQIISKLSKLEKIAALAVPGELTPADFEWADKEIGLIEQGGTE
jgi:hypothetical protein